MAIIKLIGYFLVSTLFLLELPGCSINKLAVDRSSDLFYQASLGLDTSANFEMVKDGFSAQLLQLEGFLFLSPLNLDLLLTLTKGYSGFAFAVNETSILQQEWSGGGAEGPKQQAIFNYSKALKYGFSYMKIKGIRESDLLLNINQAMGISFILDKNLSKNKKDLELVLFLAQAYVGLINLKKDDMSLVAQLPLVKAMFDWVCKIRPTINYGTCDIFNGAYEAGRPLMLGGNPKKGKEIFLNAILKQPHNWLIRTSFMRYYLIPQNDQEGFDQQLKFLKNKKSEFNSDQVYSLNPPEMFLESEKERENHWTSESHLRFYQSLALEHYELMNKYQKQFF